MGRNRSIAHLDRSQALSSLLTIANLVQHVYALVPEHAQVELEPLRDQIDAAFESIQQNALMTVDGTQPQSPFETLTALLCEAEELAGADRVVLEAERYDGNFVFRFERAGDVALVGIDPDEIEAPTRPLAGALAITAEQVWTRQAIQKQTQEQESESCR